LIAVTPAVAATLLRSLADAAQDRAALLRWCVEHVPDGVDPVPAAWAACEDDWAMYHVSSRTPRLFKPDGGYCNDCNLGISSRTVENTCAACVARLRTLIPTLRLADVVAGARA
jgi:hypothetical protein